jgi:membrane associated rhomboid family serine protease
MLILPIAQEDSTVRRTPWVSFAAIGLNVVVFLVMLVTANPEAATRAVRERAVETWEYLAERPYLEPPPALTRLLDEEALGQINEVRAQLPADAFPSEEQIAAEQAQIESLANRIDEAMRNVPSRRWGYIPAQGGVAPILTSLFMHGGWLHLFGNMLFLFLSGPFIEDRYGRPLFAAFYLLSGITATLAHGAHQAASNIPLVGASGAIAGLMGAFLIRLGASRIQFLIIPFLLMPYRYFKVFLPAFVVLPLWLGQQLWYAQTQPDAGVAWWAHIGGFAFGVAVAVTMRVARVEERWIDAGIEQQISIVQHPGLEKSVDMRLAGDFASAKREIRAVLATDPQNIDAWTEMYEIAVAAGDIAEAGRTAQRVLEMHLRKGDKDLAAHIITDAWERVTADALPVRFIMAAAAFYEKEGDARTAMEMYAYVGRRAPEDAAAFRAWFRVAEILRQSGDAKGARAAYENARRHPACVDPWPQTIDRTLAQLG